MRRQLFFILTMLVMMQTALAQQPLKNTAFKVGEKLEYKLYFNWQFIWVNAGTATMSISEQQFNGKPSYRCALVTRSSQKIDKYFRMRDTLLCNVTKDLVPLYYRKGADEGKRYYVDELFYSYNNGTRLLAKELTSSGEHLQHQYTSKDNLYDMLSIFLRARSFNADNWKTGHTYVFRIADGKGIKDGKLRFRGRTTVKSESGTKYKCLELSYIEKENGKDKEIVRFFVTDDSKHVPVRLDLNLRFGTAKAFLK